VKAGLCDCAGLRSKLGYHSCMVEPRAEAGRIAYFGGSFDPPHAGHLAIARAALRALSLDKVLFAPVGLQPLKPGGSSASFVDRVAMTQLAIGGETGFYLSLADSPDEYSSSPNYTIGTLTRLRRSLRPGTELFLLVGADSFRTLPQWHRAAEIPFAATLIVASRPGEEFSDLASCLPSGVTSEPMMSKSNGAVVRYELTNPAVEMADLYLLPDLHYDVSATRLREEIHRRPANSIGKDAALISPAVLEYIHQHHLYA